MGWGEREGGVGGEGGVFNSGEMMVYDVWGGISQY